MLVQPSGVLMAGRDPIRRLSWVARPQVFCLEVRPHDTVAQQILLRFGSEGRRCLTSEKICLQLL